MLADKDVVATIAVKDLKAARTFYEGTLGLQQTGPQEPGTALYKTGKTSLLVYESQFAGTNQATAATWGVDDIADVVKSLKARGITFEHYDFPGGTRQGDIHVTGRNKAAWFKDPDGNILALVNQ